MLCYIYLVDCYGPAGDGHGTHVASIAVGRNVGVAKEANVVAVRVLDCEVIDKLLTPLSICEEALLDHLTRRTSSCIVPAPDSQRIQSSLTAVLNQRTGLATTTQTSKQVCALPPSARSRKRLRPEPCCLRRGQGQSQISLQGWTGWPATPSRLLWPPSPWACPLGRWAAAAPVFVTQGLHKGC